MSLIRYQKIFLGGKCNNNCLNCPLSHKQSPLTDSSRIASFLENRESESVLLYGGEPTLRNDIYEIVNAAKNKGYRRIKVLTNGRAFANIQFLQRLLETGCNLFEIKLWGSNPSLHDHLTQTNGSFWETLAGLENLAGLALDKFFCIRIPMSRENLTDLENIVISALNFGVNRIILSVQDSGMAFESLMPHIRNAINISIFNRTWIQTDGIPFCFMRGLELHIGEIIDGLNTVYEKTFRHHKYCLECVYREMCPGAEERHLEQFGETVYATVTESKHIQAIKALYE
jgi:MoaA/NifB/PqqE/SkfB family radical SAM enzyme